MMKWNSICMALAVASIVTLAAPLPALAHRGCLYFSHLEATRFNERIEFTPGMYDGNVHSNDYFYFASPGDTVTGLLSTCQERFQFARGMSIDSLVLACPPQFNTLQTESSQ